MHTNKGNVCLEWCVWASADCRSAKEMYARHTHVSIYISTLTLVIASFAFNAVKLFRFKKMGAANSSFVSP
jgi:hypothetical protein